MVYLCSLESRQCPLMAAEHVGVCDDVCSHDAECKDAGICCNNGCGRICKQGNRLILFPGFFLGNY